MRIVDLEAARVQLYFGNKFGIKERERERVRKPGDKMDGQN